MDATVKCTTKDCEQYDRERDISYPQLASGIYLTGDVACGFCKMPMITVTPE